MTASHLCLRRKHNRPPRILVSGSRDHASPSVVEAFIASVPEGSIIIHGGAKGVDTIAAIAAERRGLHTACVKAIWKFHARAAGPRRNAAMMLLDPDYIVAFPMPDSKGTADQIKRGQTEGVETFVVAPSGRVIAHHNSGPPVRRRLTRQQLQESEAKPLT